MNRTLTCQDNIVEVFNIFDDFAQLINSGKKVGRKPTLSLSEVATISLIRKEYDILHLI